MNTEQCWPSETPCGAASAIGPSSETWATPVNSRPCSSMNEPVPALHASFIADSTTRPSSSRTYLASWPPISNMVSTRGSSRSAPAAWAAISLSTSTESGPKQAESSGPTTSRPLPVAPTAATGAAPHGWARNSPTRRWAAPTGSPAVAV